MLLDRQAGLFISGGEDGRICWWGFTPIEAAEVDDDNPQFKYDPVREVQMPEGVSVRGFVQMPEGLVVQDSNGALYRIPTDSGAPGVDVTPETLVAGHAGAITGVATSPVDHFAVTCGLDGTVRGWDYVDQKQVAKASFNAGATALTWAPTEVDREGRTVAVGFDDGVVRVLLRGAESFPLLHVFKPHSGRVNCVSYSRSGAHLVTGGQDGTVFFLRVTEGDGTADGKEYAPIGFVDVGAPATSIDWNSRDDAILVSVGARGAVVEVRLPDGAPNTSTSYELHLDTRRFELLPPKPKPTAEQVAAQKAAEEAARKAAEEAEEKGESRPATPLANPFEEAKLDPGATLAAMYSPVADTPNASFLVRCAARRVSGPTLFWGVCVITACHRRLSELPLTHVCSCVLCRARVCVGTGGGRWHRVQRAARVHMGQPALRARLPDVRGQAHVVHAREPQRQVPGDGLPGR